MKEWSWTATLLLWFFAAGYGASLAFGFYYHFTTGNALPVGIWAGVALAYYLMGRWVWRQENGK